MEGPLMDSNSPLARHQGLGSRGRQCIKIVTILSANFDQILEPSVSKNRDPRSLPLQEGVGRDRGAVGDQARESLGKHLAQTLEDRSRGIAGGRRNLMNAQGAVDDGNQVGEGSTGIYPDRD